MINSMTLKTHTNKLNSTQQRPLYVKTNKLGKKFETHITDTDITDLIYEEFLQIGHRLTTKQQNGEQSRIQRLQKRKNISKSQEKMVNFIGNKINTTKIILQYFLLVKWQRSIFIILYWQRERRNKHYVQEWKLLVLCRAILQYLSKITNVHTTLRMYPKNILTFG